MLDLLKTFAAKGGASGYAPGKATQTSKWHQAVAVRKAQAKRFQTSEGELTVLEVFEHVPGGVQVSEATVRRRLDDGVFEIAELTAPSGHRKRKPR